jgi:hypothetical protein
MHGLTRATTTLAGVAVGGFLLWVAAQVGRHTTGGYWAAYAIVAAAGLVLGLSQMRGRTGHPPALFLFGFLPVLVIAGWVLIGMQPHGNWFRGHVLAWSGDLGVRDVVLDLGTWIGVLALAIGYTLGVVLEPAPRRRVLPAYDAAAADEPVTAERHAVATTAMTEDPVTTETPATTEEPAPVP